MSGFDDHKTVELFIERLMESKADLTESDVVQVVNSLITLPGVNRKAVEELIGELLGREVEEGAKGKTEADNACLLVFALSQMHEPSHQLIDQLMGIINHQ